MDKQICLIVSVVFAKIHMPDSFSLVIAVTIASIQGWSIFSLQNPTTTFEVLYATHSVSRAEMKHRIMSPPWQDIQGKSSPLHTRPTIPDDLVTLTIDKSLRH